MPTSNGSARLIRIFLSELDERLSSFDADLSALAEPAPEADRAETVTRLFRGAHSLKGAAASVGASGIESVCQQLEDVLAKVRDGALALDAERCAMLVAAAGEVREAARRLANEAEPSPAAAAPAPPPAPVPAPAPPPRRAGSRIQARADTLRVPAERVDALLEHSGELLVSHHRIDDLLRQVDEAASTVQRLHTAPPGAGRKQHREQLRELHRSLERIATSMQAERMQLQRAASALDERIRSIRMLPFGVACEGLERVVHDAAEATGKQVRLEIDGADVGVDRAMVDRLRDPLVQLVRNAVDHGIESPNERLRRGKPACGTITLSVSPREREVTVRVSDDGGGLDLDRLRRRVAERGIAIADEDLAQAVFLPGVSTAASVTNLSGRGVGLDVVRTELEGLGGSVDVASSPDGTTFVLSFPLTVTTVRVILFTLAGRTFGFNVTSVERVVRVDPAAIAVIEGRSVMLYGENRIPFVPLHAVLGIEPPADGATPPIAVVVKRRGHSVAMGVDALLDEREVHLRPLGPRLGALPKVSGAAIAGDGSVALILRGAAVIESALATARTLRSAPAAPAQTVAAKRVLLVDDSITTRTLERSILEAAGYEVLTAADGHDAWTLLGEQSVDVVVSDVDMPRMNGFALVEAVRTSSSLRELPIILVTARESEIDRQRGLESGADAYIVKSSFRQEELLEAIGALT